jgi:membrane associated rhomboid family serine protease
MPGAGLIGFWSLTQLFNLEWVTKAQIGGVACTAHVAGAVFGTLTARFFEDPERLAAQL